MWDGFLLDSVSLIGSGEELDRPREARGELPGGIDLFCMCITREL